MKLQLEMSPEAAKLLDHLRSKPQEFTFSEAQNITGVNDLARVRGYIYTCLRRLRKEKVWYRSVRGVGYRLVGENEKNKIQTGRIDTVAKTTRKIDKDQDNINVSVMNRDAKLEFTFNSARIGRILSASSRETAREIKREIGNGKLPLDKD